MTRFTGKATETVCIDEKLRVEHFTALTYTMLTETVVMYNLDKCERRDLMSREWFFLQPSEILASCQVLVRLLCQLSVCTGQTDTRHYRPSPQQLLRSILLLLYQLAMQTMI